MLAATDFKAGPATWAWASGAVMALAVAVFTPARLNLNFISVVLFFMSAMAAPNRHAGVRQPKRAVISLCFFAASFVVLARVAYAKWLSG